MVDGYAPQNLQEALELRRREAAVPYGGGTDLMVEGGHPGPWLFLHRVPELGRIESRDGYLRIGAACTFTQVLTHPLTPPILREAVEQIAAPAIRNLGTIGGNIGNGSAKADSVLVFYAADALVRVANADGERTVPIGRFYLGRKQLDLAPDELIVEVLLPLDMPREYVYHKVGARQALAISRLSFAALWSVEGGRIAALSTAFGAIDQTVIRRPEIDNMLVGAEVSALDRVRGTYLAAWAEALDPIAGRVSAEYRKRVCLNLLEDALGRME